MGSKIIKIAMIVLVLGIVSTNQVNAQTISEDELSITVLKWFYNHYDNPVLPTWEKVASESNEEMYKVSFGYNGDDYVAIYSKNGKRAYENIVYNKKQRPVSLIDFAETNYEKFKVLDIVKHTNFEYGARLDKDTNYELVVKVDGVESSIWFNEDMNRYSNFDVSNLALK